MWKGGAAIQVILILGDVASDRKESSSDRDSETWKSAILKGGVVGGGGKGMGIQSKPRGLQALGFLCQEADSGDQRIRKSELCVEGHPRAP